MSKKRSYYDVLGIARDAGSGDIKKAVRKARRAVHPDLHPHADPDAVREVNEAAACLQDPVLRLAYDQGGERVGPEAQAFAAAMKIVCQFITRALEEEVEDAPKFIRELVLVNIHAGVKRVQEIKAMSAKLKKRRARIKRKSGANLFHEVIDQQLQAWEKEIEGTERGIAGLTEMLAELTGYEDMPEVDERNGRQLGPLESLMFLAGAIS